MNREQTPLHLSPEFLAKKASQGGTIFDKSVPGREACVIPDVTGPEYPLPPDEYLRTKQVILPEVSQLDLVRHFNNQSKLNHSISGDDGMYPLGSCTMKENPKVHELIVGIPNFSEVHPAQPEETRQGTLKMVYELQQDMAQITGMHETSPVLMGGAQGELAGVLVIKQFHIINGEGDRRKKMLIPDSAHGTNPASAAMAGFTPIQIESDSDGNSSLEHVRKVIGDGTEVAGFMGTQPNTLGLWDNNFGQVTQMIHDVGGLVYGDGANLNAILGKVKLGELGFDVIHTNLHKAFSTPHGGGGPGAGPIMVSEKLSPFLPGPIVTFDENTNQYKAVMPEHSIGKMSGWAGNTAVLLRAYSYIRTMGEDGLREVANTAVLNANYLKSLLGDTFSRGMGDDRTIMHELVVQGFLKGKMVPHLMNDMAKRLIDYGIHPPTVYFPIILKEAMMIEPPESESKESIELLAAALLAVAKEAEENPELLKSAPHISPVGRLNETEAARHPILKWTPQAK